MVNNKIWSCPITTCSLVVGMNVLLLSPNFKTELTMKMESVGCSKRVSISKVVY